MESDMEELQLTVGAMQEVQLALPDDLKSDNDIRVEIHGDPCVSVVPHIEKHLMMVVPTQGGKTQIRVHLAHHIQYFDVTVEDFQHDEQPG